MNKQGDNSIEVNLFLKDKLPSRPLVFERGKNVYFISLPATVYNGPRKIDVAAFKDEISNVTIDFVPYKTSKNSGYTRIIIETKNKTKITIKDTAGIDAQSLAFLILKILAALASAGLLGVGAFWGHKKFITNKNLDNLLDVDEVYIENAQNDTDAIPQKNEDMDVSDVEVLNFVNDIENDNNLIEDTDTSENGISKDLFDENLNDNTNNSEEQPAPPIVLENEIDNQEIEQNDITEEPNILLGEDIAKVVQDDFSEQEFVEANADFYPSGDEIVSDILNNEEVISEIADSINDDIMAEVSQDCALDADDDIAQDDEPEKLEEKYSSVGFQSNSQVGVFASKSFNFTSDVQEVISQENENITEEPEESDIPSFEEFTEKNTHNDVVDLELMEEVSTNAYIEPSELEDTAAENLLEIFADEAIENDDRYEDNNTEGSLLEEDFIETFNSFVGDIPEENEIVPDNQDAQLISDEDTDDDSIFDELIQESQDNSEILLEEFITDEDEEIDTKSIILEEDLSYDMPEQIADDDVQNENIIAQDDALQTVDILEEKDEPAEFLAEEIIESSENAQIADENIEIAETLADIEHEISEEFADNEPIVDESEQNITEIQLDTDAFFKEEVQDANYINEDTFYKDEEEYIFPSEVLEPDEFYKDEAPEVIDDSEPFVVSSALVDDEKNIYLIRHNSEFSLIGVIADEIFVLNKFSEPPTKEKIILKLNETRENQNIYIVKVDAWRALIAIDENGMENILTLS